MVTVIGEAIALNILSQLTGNCIAIVTNLLVNPTLFKNENNEFLVRLQIQHEILKTIKNTIDTPETQSGLEGSDISWLFKEIMGQIRKLLRTYIKRSGLPSAEKRKLLEASAERFLEQIEAENAFVSLSSHTSRSRSFWTRLVEETSWTIRVRDRNEELVAKVEFWTEQLDRLVSCKIPSMVSRTTSTAVMQRITAVTGNLKRTQLKNKMSALQNTNFPTPTAEPTDLAASRITSLGGNLSLFSLDWWKDRSHLAGTSQRRMAELTTEGRSRSLVIVEFNGRPDNDLPSKSKEIVREDLKLLVRVLRLARENPGMFRVLDCHGWYEAKDHFGLVYKVPAGSQDAECESLTNILLNHTHLKYLAEVENRLNLAKALAWTLFEFHSADWVHESFAPDNILFFIKKDTEAAFIYDWSSPYVVGFSLARMEGGYSGPINEKSVADISPYVHADRQRKDYIKFQKVHDLYSLGVVLLEIGRLGSFLEKRAKKEWSTAQSPDKVKEIMMRKAGALRVHMGNRYTEAVMACLTANEVLSNQDEPDFLTFFLVEVCEKLEEIVI
jgi:hypothetical protein